MLLAPFLLLALATSPGDDKPAPVAPKAQGDSSGTAQTAAAATSRRNYSTGTTVLEIGGREFRLAGFSGTAQRLDPGGALDSRGGAKTRENTKNGGIRCEDVEMAFSALPDPALLQWFDDAIHGKQPPQSAKLRELTADGANPFVHSLRDASLRSLELGPLDARSKEPLEWRATLGASEVRWEKESGSAAAKIGEKLKPQLAANFRLKIDGIATSGVIAIHPIRADVDLISNGTATNRNSPGPVTIAPIELELREDDPTPWLAWLEAGAATSAASERNGTLELLDSALKETQFRLVFQGLQVMRLARTAGIGEKNAPTLQVELRCKTLRIETTGK